MGDTRREAAVQGIPQFAGTGYDTWQFRVKMFLQASKVWNVISEEPPTAAAEVAKYQESDWKAKSLLVSFIADEYLGCIREKETAREMWKSLEDTFAKKSTGRQTLIRKQIARLHLKDGGSMRAHLLEFEDLIRQLRMAGSKLEESDVCSSLSLTLPESYDPLVTALENLPEKDLTYDVMKTRLIDEESKRNERSQNTEERPAAFAGEKQKKANSKFNGKCHVCGKRGHMKKDCRRNKGNANLATDAKAVVFMADCSGTKRDSVGRIIFKLDSGSSDHLVNTKKCFATLSELKQPVRINVAKDGQSLTANQMGVVTGISNRGVLMQAKDVLFVPDLRDNLMSVKKLTKAGVDVIFGSKMK